MMRERHSAERRLREWERLARVRLVLDGPALDRSLIPDADRLAAPLLERLGVRGRVQLLLWTSVSVVFLLALVSFFSAPLMDPDIAVSGGLLFTMLLLAYVM